MDLPNDELTQTDTFVRAFGGDRSSRLMKSIIFPLELACILAWFILTSMQLPLLLLILPIYGIRLLIDWQKGPELGWTKYNHAPLIYFHINFCPLFFGLLLVCQHPIYLPLFGFQIIWQQIRNLIRFSSILGK